MGILSQRNKDVCGMTVLQLPLTDLTTDDGLTTRSISIFGDTSITTGVNDPFGRNTGVATFDGSGDYLRVGSHEDLNLYDLEFTIELWFKTTKSSESSILTLSNSNSFAGPGNFALDLNTKFSSSHIQVWVAGSGGVSGQIGPGIAINDNNWHHLAVTRIGDTFTLYVDGVGTSGTHSGTLSSGMSLSLGARFGGNLATNGEMCNVRIIKGKAIYTKNFSVPTIPFPKCFKPTDISSLVCWLDANKLSQSDASAVSTWSDRTSNSNDFTQGTGANQPTFQTNESNGRSVVRFDGSDDIMAASSKFTPTGAKTIAIVFKPTGGDGTAALFQDNAVDITNREGTYIGYLTGSAKVEFQGGMSGGPRYAAVSQSTLNDGNYHILYHTWDGTTGGGKVQNIVNGLLESLDTAASVASPPTFINPEIGNRSGGLDTAFGGDLCEILVFSEVLPNQDKNRLERYLEAKYNTKSLSPTRLCITDAGTPNQVLLLHGEGPNGESDFVDSSSSNHTITSVGTAQHDTSQKPFGFSSMTFDGTGDYLSIPDSEDWNFGTGDWTIETWVKFDRNTGSTMTIFQQGDPAGGAPANRRITVRLLYFPGSTLLYATLVESTSVINTPRQGSFAPTVGEWYHIAVVCESGTGKIYVDGKDIGGSGGDWSLGQQASAADFRVGAMEASGGTADYLEGQMKEFRVVKGTAVYTSNFKPRKRFYCDN